MTGKRESRLLLLIVACLAISGCDSASSPTCEVLGTDTYPAWANFVERSNETVAEFQFTQKVNAYETGDCELPSTTTDGVYLVVRNLTNCTLDINFTLSVFEGVDGWTLSRSSRVQAGAAEDIGRIHRDTYPRVDRSQIILSGTVVRSDCGGAKS